MQSIKSDWATHRPLCLLHYALLYLSLLLSFKSLNEPSAPLCDSPRTQQQMIVCRGGIPSGTGRPMDVLSACGPQVAHAVHCGPRRDPFPALPSQLVPNWVRAERQTGSTHRLHIHRAVNERGL